MPREIFLKYTLAGGGYGLVACGMITSDIYFIIGGSVFLICGIFGK